MYEEIGCPAVLALKIWIEVMFSIRIGSVRPRWTAAMIAGSTLLGHVPPLPSDAPTRAPSRTA